MSTFSQWWVSYIKKPAARQVTWVCGSERILVDEVVNTLTETIGAEPFNLIPIAVGEVRERAIWAEIDQHPVGKGNRLVVLRNAEKLKNPEKLIEFVKRRQENPRTHLIFVSNEERVPRDEPTEHSKVGEPVAYIRALTGKGYVVECRAFTNDTAKHAIAWVKSKVLMREGIASHLLTRANGDLRLVRDVCTKLAIFPGEISITTINNMLTERPQDTFVDALLALKKPVALLALRDVPRGDYSRLIGLLDSTLDLAGTIHDMQLEHRPMGEILRAAGKKNFLVKDLVDVAKHYDPKRRLVIRRILSQADQNLRAGSSVGVFESVVAFW